MPAGAIEGEQRRETAAEILAPPTVAQTEDLSELNDYLMMSEARLVDSIMNAARLHREEASTLIKVSWRESDETTAEAAAAQSALHVTEFQGYVARLQLLGIGPGDIPQTSLKDAPFKRYV
jgi:hypothetical protein